MYVKQALLILLFLGLFFSSTAQLPPVSNHIHIDQFGYVPDLAKVAVISDPQTGANASESFNPGATYEVRKYPGAELVSSGAVVPWNQGAVHTQSGDKAWSFDFSSLDQDGEYYIYDPTNDVRSHAFEVGGEVYKEVLKQAVRTFYYQRSGFAKQAPYTDSKWADVASHMGTEQDLDCRLVTNPIASTSLDLSGGWYDAGDYNKYVNFTQTTVQNLLYAYEKNPDIWGDDFNIPESGNGIPDLLDELKYELDWLLKMQLPDGSGLMKVSVVDFAAASPPSADNAFRRYGPAQSSATRTLASNFSHASIIYGSLADASMQSFADTLLARAEKAWTWTENNPALSFYDNSGFQSANPEVSEYDQFATKFAAAVYLYAKTGKAVYKDFVDNNYTDLHALQWNFWYPYETAFQDALLYYANLSTATPAVVTAIRNSFIGSVSSGNPSLFTAYQSNKDPYRAQLEDQDYVWGSNMVKSHTGIILSNMAYYDLQVNQTQQYRDNAAGYLHYIHGVNPLNLCFLSNMGDYGAENSINEIYHAWFGDGTDWDHAQNSLYGPAPGYLSGGANPSYAPSQGYFSPPQDQPIQKSYLDWNTSWPQNSWEITEPAIYYQAAYIHLLSQYVGSSENTLAVEYESFVAFERGRFVELQWTTATELGTTHFLIERSIDGQMFEPIGRVGSQGNAAEYQFTDASPPEGKLYYRLKEVEADGSYSYSEIRTVIFQGSLTLTSRPNPITNEVYLELNLPSNTSFVLELLTLNGQVVRREVSAASSQTQFEFSWNLEQLSAGIYMVKLQADQDILYKKIIKE